MNCCPGCGQQIPTGAPRCPGCGWSFAEGNDGDSGPEAVGRQPLASGPVCSDHLIKSQPGARAGFGEKRPEKQAFSSHRRVSLGSGSRPTFYRVFNSGQGFSGSFSGSRPVAAFVAGSSVKRSDLYPDFPEAGPNPPAPTPLRSHRFPDGLVSLYDPRRRFSAASRKPTNAEPCVADPRRARIASS